MGLAVAIILLLLFAWRLAVEVGQEMKKQSASKPPEPAPKKEEPPIITNHFHLTQNNYTIKEKE